jgi:hypothetical protein
MRKVLLAAACFALACGQAQADYLVSTPTVAPTNAILQTIKSGTLNGGLLPWMNLVDTTGTPLGTASNPLSFNCLSGCSGGGGGGGTSSNFSSAFPSAGTALGLSNGTNMVPWLASSNYGTGPGAIAVPAVNAFITNTVPVSGSVTATQATGTNLHMVCDSGCSSSSSPTFGATFPTTGTPIGMSQGGNLTALTGTGGALNVNISSGSIGNTSFAATQATASALNATVVGTGTFAVQATLQASSTTAIGTVNPTAAANWGVNTMGSTTSGQSGQLALGAVTTGSPSYTTAQSNALSLTTAGALRTDASATTQPISAASGAIGVGAGLDGWDVTKGTKADPVATVPTSTTVASEISLLKAIANLLNGAVPLGSASGGLSVKTLPALTNTAIAVKAAAGQVYKGQCSNADTTHWAYLQLFNVAAASVTMGTTAPADFVGIPPGSNTGFTMSLVGEQFSTAISAGVASSSTGGTAPTTTLDCTVAFN